MFKATALLRRKSGMSVPDLVDHYESNHAVLAVKDVSSLKNYVRHYLTAFGNVEYGVSELPYDAITEIWFED
ncbi:MAG: EthD domain-containing protein [Gammaproteobacteria bacterium]|nr:EthD domain-containing protein [Gammaproteobacteria bacterium]